MAFLANLLVKLGVDTQELNAGMDRATRSVNKFGQDVTAAGKSLAMGITLPLGAAAAAALKASADMESLTKGLTSITGSASKTNEQLTRLKEVAKLPGLGFQEAVRGSINLQAAGFNAQLAEKALKSFGNALATVGKGKAELDGVILALTQIAAKGKVSAEEINQLQERLPQIRKAMKDAFGTADTEVLKKMGIDSQQFIEKITAEFAKLPPVTSGLNNSFENLRDSAFQALAKIGDVLRPFAQDFIDNRVEPMIQKIKEFAESFAALPKPVQNAVLGVGTAAAVFPLLAIAIGQTITNTIVIAGAFGKLATVVKGLLPLLGAPLGIAAALGAIGIAAWKAGDYLQERFGKGADQAAESIKRLNEQSNKSDLIKSLSHGGGSVGLASANSQNTISAALEFVATKTTKVGEAAKVATKEVDKLASSLSKLSFQELKNRGLLRGDPDQIAYLAAIGQEWNSNPGVKMPSMDDLWNLPGSTDTSGLKTIDRNAELLRDTLGAVVTEADLAARNMDGLGKATVKVAKEANEFQRQIDRTFNRLARGIADSIINWKGFGATLKDIAKDMASSFLEIMIRQLIKPLEDQFAKLAGALGKALGLGGGAASGAANAAGGAASAGGGAASAAGGAASMGISGVLNTAFAGLSAGMAVVNGFQMHGVNKSLDVLVNHSLRQFNVAAQTLDFLYTWNTQWFARTSDIWNEIRNVVAAVREGGTGGGGKGGVTVNVYGNLNGDPNAIAQAIFDKFALANG